MVLLYLVGWEMLSPPSNATRNQARLRLEASKNNLITLRFRPCSSNRESDIGSGFKSQHGPECANLYVGCGGS